MNLYGLSAIPRLNAQRKYGVAPDSAGFGYLARQSGGGSNAPETNPYFDYDASTHRGGLLPGGMMRASPSQTGQPRSVYGVEFPVVGYPATGWDPNQRLDQYQGSIPGVGMPLRGEIGGGPSSGQQTYSSSITPFDPLDYSANPPPNEDVSPIAVNTFYGSTAFNGPPTRRATGVDAGYPDLSGAPPVSVSAPYGTASNPYPIPGLGVGTPSGDWRQNATWQGFPRTAGGSSGVGGSGYGSGRFAGPSVSFGYGGTMIGPTSGSIFGGNPSHGTILGY